jgi:hypothetical protein
MKNHVFVWEAEFKEIDPAPELKHVDASSFDETVFAQMDWEIDSIMREIDAR